MSGKMTMRHRGYPDPYAALGGRLDPPAQSWSAEEVEAGHRADLAAYRAAVQLQRIEQATHAVYWLGLALAATWLLLEWAYAPTLWATASGAWLAYFLLDPGGYRG